MLFECALSYLSFCNTDPVVFYRSYQRIMNMIVTSLTSQSWNLWPASSVSGPVTPKYLLCDFQVIWVAWLVSASGNKGWLPSAGLDGEAECSLLRRNALLWGLIGFLALAVPADTLAVLRWRTWQTSGDWNTFSSLLGLKYINSLLRICPSSQILRLCYFIKEW